MARNYSTRDFFRQMPKVLLACYFQEQAHINNLRLKLDVLWDT